MKVSTLVIVAFLALAGAGAQTDAYRFAVLGDRTGETEPGVFEQVCQEMAAQNPAFVVSVGDSIQGGTDATAEAQWREFEAIRAQFRRLPLYLAPGNHDIWSELSERLYVRHAGHPVHYSFDYKQTHFTILDNSRTEGLPAGEMAFLEDDLKAHADQPVKVILSHRPSWIFSAMLRDTRMPLHAMAKKYGVQYIIAGHVHQMMHFELEGVTYISAPSSGGHLRASKNYDDGWLFGHIVAEVNGNQITFQVRETAEPHGKKRISELAAWGGAGLAAQ